MSSLLYLDSCRFAGRKAWVTLDCWCEACTVLLVLIVMIGPGGTWSIMYEYPVTGNQKPDNHLQRHASTSISLVLVG